jgi:hypothetical protein
MPQRIKDFTLLHTYGIPDFRDGITTWNAAWELHFPFFDSTFIQMIPGPEGQSLINVHRNMCTEVKCTLLRKKEEKSDARPHS